MPCWTATDYEALWQFLYIIPNGFVSTGCHENRIGSLEKPNLRETPVSALVLGELSDKY